MESTLSSVDIVWLDDGTPRSQRFNDTYFAAGHGRAETRFVFLENNDLPARFDGDHAVGELGFGTGLSFLETWALWRLHRPDGARLLFQSVEAYPMSADALAACHAGLEGLEEVAAALRARWDDALTGPVTFEDGVTLHVHVGDVADTLQRFEKAVDTWFLDGFSPANNPEMWSSEVMRAVADRSASGSRFASYTAAGWVRRNLQDAGFAVERRKGFGRKRHMIAGHLKERA